MLKWDDVIKLANEGNPVAEKRVEKTEQEWRQQLTPEQFRITRQKGTEMAYSSQMCAVSEPGLYACACCGSLLFDAEKKFESGSGWPSFTQPIDDHAIAYHQDGSYGMNRIETTCHCCDAHLGHVFPDGPEPSGLRYCMNAVALNNVSAERGSLEVAQPNTQKATFGGGCFWCTEAIFRRLEGVSDVRSGYAGGELDNPSYHAVCGGQTGHAEVIDVTYDPDVISYSDLIRIHLTTHDPTTLNQQGADKGTQYRSVVFVQSDAQRETVQRIIDEVQPAYENPIVTEVERFSAFYEAEVEHQDFYRRQPQYGYCRAVIEPKLAKFKALYADKMNTD